MYTDDKNTDAENRTILEECVHPLETDTVGYSLAFGRLEVCIYKLR